MDGGRIEGFRSHLNSSKRKLEVGTYREEGRKEIQTGILNLAGLGVFSLSPNLAFCNVFGMTAAKEAKQQRPDLAMEISLHTSSKGVIHIWHTRCKIALFQYRFVNFLGYPAVNWRHTGFCLQGSWWVSCMYAL